MSDVIITFESDFAAYMEYTPRPWHLTTNATRLGHIVYNTLLAGNQHLTAIRASKTHNAGVIYLTTETLPNPYKSLPTKPVSTIMHTLLRTLG